MTQRDRSHQEGPQEGPRASMSMPSKSTPGSFASQGFALPQTPTLAAKTPRRSRSAGPSKPRAAQPKAVSQQDLGGSRNLCFNRRQCACRKLAHCWLPHSRDELLRIHSNSCAHFPRDEGLRLKNRTSFPSHNKPLISRLYGVLSR